MMATSRRAVQRALAIVMLCLGMVLGAGMPAYAAHSSAMTTVTMATPAQSGTAATMLRPAAPDRPTVSIDIGGTKNKPSSSIMIIVAITLLSVAPALLLMTTSFTKIIVVLGLTRNALGVQSLPPNQVLVGLAMFLSLFVMGPVLSEVNNTGVQPYMKGEKSQSQAFVDGTRPLKSFMLDHTRREDLALITRAAKRPNPETREDTPLQTLIPAFMISELRAAFIIGFVIFIPFLIIDLVVSAVLMSMGMMMLPPMTVALPFKLLLFVLVDGWGLVIQAILGSYN